MQTEIDVLGKVKDVMNQRLEQEAKKTFDEQVRANRILADLEETRGDYQNMKISNSKKVAVVKSRVLELEQQVTQVRQEKELLLDEKEEFKRLSEQQGAEMNVMNEDKGELEQDVKKYMAQVDQL